MKSPLRIASRQSTLALAQIDEIVAQLKSKGIVFDYEIIKIDTTGDIDKTTPLTQSPDNFFTDCLDRALLEQKADIAIHSAKDLPQNMPEGTKIYALTKAKDDRDAWVGNTHWKGLPQGAKVGTSSTLRQKQILQMRPDVKIVQIRGSIHERLQLIKEGKIDGAVVAYCALKRLKLEDQVKDIFPWEGMPLQGQLAVTGRPGDEALEKLFSSIDVRRHYGKVTLVGAGPGDPELITLKGVNALKHADCVVYDYLLDVSLLKYATHAEHIYAGKRKGQQVLSQEDLSRLLKEKAFAGKNVVRLKGGDPLIFARGADEILYLRAYHIHVDIIPGVSSATGIPSSLGIPLTARGISSSVAFVSGHEEDEDKDHPRPVAIPKADTLVFLMGLTKLGIIVQSLQNAGWPLDTPMMIIASGTKPQEEILKATLSTIEAEAKTYDLKPPALILAGKTIEFYQSRLKKSYLHCGTHPELYHYLGKIVHWPMITIKPVQLSAAQRQDLLKAYEEADIVVCTSWYAGEHFIKEMLSIKPDVQWSDKVFTVIGQRTKKALQDHGIEPLVVSYEETAQGLYKAMAKQLNLQGKKILFPRSSLPNPYLKEALESQGAQVKEITIYENTKPPRRELPALPINGVIFTSPSTVRNFLEDYATIPASWDIIAKGPVTKKTLQEAGYSHAASLS